MKSLLTFFTTLLVVTLTSALPATVDNTTLVDRQSCFPAGSCTRLEGDGDPHQWILHRQITDAERCNFETCVVGLHPVNAPAGMWAYAKHETDFIDGGFDVVESLQYFWYTKCYSDRGVTGCVYANVWHTDYTVRGGVANQCALDGCNEFDDTSIIRAPNAVHQGIDYSCKYGSDCVEKFHEWWELGPAGGPPQSPEPEPEPEPESAAMVDRQSCFPGGSCTRLEGDGDPHQWILRKQLGIFDGPPHTTFKSTHDTDWIDGGFNVVDELTIHTDKYEHNCSTANVPNTGKGCLWVSIWHTDYTVRGGIANQCDPDGCQEYDHTSVIRSPNAVHGSVEYYCLWDEDCVNPERPSDQEIWDFAGAGPPPASSHTQSAALVERQNCIPAGDCSPLEGNGDPHQWILEKQISLWLDCGGTNCKVQDWEQESYTIKADTHGLTFTSGGFEVWPSVETGIYEAGCSGVPHQRVCVKAAIWHTDFTVRPGLKNSCMPGCNTLERTVIIRAPNTINNGVQYLCRYDDECREQGHEEWFPSIAGPPPALAALEKRQDDCAIGSNSACAELDGNSDTS